MTTFLRFLVPLMATSFLGVGTAAGSPRAGDEFLSVDISAAKCCKSFSLQDTSGRRRSLSDFRGKVVVLVFGFTRCSEICPTALADMARAVRTLGAKGSQLQVLFVTLDPERDLPQFLGKYVTSFDKRFIGLSGSAKETEAVAREFRVFYKKEAGSTPEDYVVDHTTGSFVFDRAGNVRLFVSHGKPDRLVADIQRLLQER